jgi:hypothetical protein
MPGSLIASFERADDASEALERLYRGEEATARLLLVAFDDAGNVIAAWSCVGTILADR